MKTLIILAVGLLIVGCGKTENDKQKADLEANPNPDGTLSKKDIVGTYESKGDKNTYRKEFLDNGDMSEYLQNKEYIRRWSIVGKEVHVTKGKSYDKGEVYIYELNSDNGLTWIAEIKKMLDVDAVRLGKGRTYRMKRIKAITPTTYKRIK